MITECQKMPILASLYYVKTIATTVTCTKPACSKNIERLPKGGKGGGGVSSLPPLTGLVGGTPGSRKHY